MPTALRTTTFAPLTLVLALAAVTAGCGGGKATPTERLWISGLPTNPKAPISAFATMRTDSERYFGAFFTGTLLRGGHDVFEWKSRGKSGATLKFLQDDRQARIELSTCEPTRGFDYCLQVEGDPTGTGRYYSRKRWVVRRPGRRQQVAGAFVLDVMAELAADDDELAAALGEAD